MSQKTAIIIGAGPAGLTAAYELLAHTDVKPIIYEMSEYVGGISKTVNYRGNRIDIGGHRFFSKSDRIMDWWLRILPIQGLDPGPDRKKIAVSYQRQQRRISTESDGQDPASEARVMLIRSRLSRIMFLHRFFDYPISLNTSTIRNLGFVRMTGIGGSYLYSKLFSVRPENTLEDFFINRFGRKLYQTFFRDYTEKVWGVPCNQIEASWGAQRIKGLSVSRAILHALRRMLKKDRSVDQKSTETSLIEFFLYPKFGPGQMWEEVARSITEKGGEIHHGYRAVGMTLEGSCVARVQLQPVGAQDPINIEADYVVSTMPVRELVNGLEGEVPKAVREAASELEYRDFITVGILLRRLDVQGNERGEGLNMVPDNWIYIQEPEVRMGRIQVFNNWSPYMVSSSEAVWIGLEYFCNEGDNLWTKSDAELIDFAIRELEQIQFALREDVLDATVLRQPKAYPGYFGGYRHFPKVRAYLDTLENLFLIGRNGMHRYNNQDHSMLTAMAAVENIATGKTAKENIWAVNAEEEYHEEK